MVSGLKPGYILDCMYHEKSIYEGGGHQRTGLACIGRVVSVDADTRTCRVKTLGMPGSTDDLDLQNVKLMQGLWHPEGDEDVAIPRIGCYAIVIFITGEPLVIGYYRLSNTREKGARSSDISLTSGDRILSTVGGNRLVLRSGGTVQLESTEGCRTFWIPSRNLINSVCQNYELETDGGHLFWTNTGTTREDGDPTRYDLLVWDALEPFSAIREQRGASETGELYKLELGELDEDLNLTAPTITETKTYDGVTTSAVALKTTRTIGTEDSKYYTETIDAEAKTMTLTTPTGNSVTFDDNAGTITIMHAKGSKIFFDASGEIVISTDSPDVKIVAPKALVRAQDIELGDTVADHAVLYAKMKMIFDNHQVMTPLGPSTPPIPPFTMALKEAAPAESAKATHIQLKGNS